MGDDGAVFVDDQSRQITVGSTGSGYSEKIAPLIAGARRPRVMLFWTGAIVAAFISLICISSIVEMPSTVRGNGVVVTETGIVSINSKIDGVVVGFFAETGQKVSVGETLLNFETSLKNAELEALRLDLEEVLFELSLLQSLMNEGSNYCETAKSLTSNGVRQDSIFSQRCSEFESQESQLAALIDELELLRVRSAEAQSLQLLNQERLILEQEALASHQDLLDRGLGTAARVVDAKRAVVSVKDAMLRTDGDVSEAQAEIKALSAKIHGLENEHEADHNLRKSGLLAKERELSLQVQSIEEWFESSEIRSPVSGVVIDHVGAFTGNRVSRGEYLISILPDDEKIMFNARLRDKDVRQIRAGNPVTLSLASHPKSEFGTIEGFVVSVSPAEIQEDGYFFNVRVCLDRSSFDGGYLPPGVSGELNIILERYTMLERFIRLVSGDKSSRLQEPANSERPGSAACEI